LKYGNFTQSWLFLQQLKPCPTKMGIFLVTYNQECKYKKKRKGYMHFLVGMKHVYLY